MSNGTTQTFNLPEGWTVRKVATTMAREWLTPFRAEPAAKGARWVVQSVVEEPRGEAPLWEAGISTSDYEERLNRADLCWAIRASAGRGKNTTLARLVVSKDRPVKFQMVNCLNAFPDKLFDAEKLEEFLKDQGMAGQEALFTAILESQGFEKVSM